MSDQGFAKVGDVIELGEPIPNNVVRMRDAATVEPNEHWSRSDTNPAAFQYLRADGTYGPETSVAQLIDWPKWWPMRVLAVAAPLARVGDVIAHGQAIPANVREMSDLSSENGWGRWVRSTNGRWNWTMSARGVEHAELREGGCSEADMTHPESECAPYRVEAVSYNRPPVGFEVDPEPQPAARCCSGMIQYGQHDRYCPARPDPEPQPAEPVDLLTLIKRWGDHMYRMGVYERARDTERARSVSEEGGSLMRQIKAVIRQHTAESGPVVLSLPQVPRVFEVPQSPEDVTRVSDSQAAIWALDSDDNLWHCDEQGWSPLPWHLLLADHGPLVEAAPPREPRTWPRLVDEATSDLPDVVDVIGDGRWHRLTEPGAEHLYARPGHEDNWRLSLRGLREWGEVREVLT